MSDHDLMIKYKAALQSIVAIYLNTPTNTSTLYHIANSALKGDK